MEKDSERASCLAAQEYIPKSTPVIATYSHNYVSLESMKSQFKIALENKSRIAETKMAEEWSFFC
jgi:hypothetical protein